MGARRDDGGAAQPAAQSALPPLIGGQRKLRRGCPINQAIGRHGLQLIAASRPEKAGERVNVLTHANARLAPTVDVGTATAPIYAAHDQGVAVHVWSTRPDRATRALAHPPGSFGQHGVPHT